MTGETTFVAVRFNDAPLRSLVAMCDAGEARAVAKAMGAAARELGYGGNISFDPSARSTDRRMTDAELSRAVQLSTYPEGRVRVATGTCDASEERDATALMGSLLSAAGVECETESRRLTR